MSSRLGLGLVRYRVHKLSVYTNTCKPAKSMNSSNTSCLWRPIASEDMTWKWTRNINNPRVRERRVCAGDKWKIEEVTEDESRTSDINSSHKLICYHWDSELGSIHKRQCMLPTNRGVRQWLLLLPFPTIPVESFPLLSQQLIPIPILPNIFIPIPIPSNI